MLAAAPHDRLRFPTITIVSSQLLPETSLPERELAQGSQEVDSTELGPVDVDEGVLGVRSLPEEEAGETGLPTGSNTLF